jgi:cytochrome c553
MKPLTLMSFVVAGAFGAIVAWTAPAAAQQAGNANAARAVNSACAGCHSIPGYQASFPKVFRVPMISGQSEKYIEAALQAYRRGERSHPTMTAIAQGLTDQEIADLAAYYAARGATTNVAAK